MSESVVLVAIVGSLRAESVNRAAFGAAAELAGLQVGVSLREVSLAEVPLYNGDVEAVGDPSPVVELKRAVDDADGLVIFTPEYNRSIPAVTKNAIDWMSRLPRQGVINRAAVGVVASTVGGHDASGVRGHLGDSLSALTPAGFHPDTLGIGSIGDKLTDGRLTDDETRRALAAWLEGFVSHVIEHRSKAAAAAD